MCMICSMKKSLRNMHKILVRIPDNEWPFWEM
jgi:hypothetical protein